MLQENVPGMPESRVIYKITLKKGGGDNQGTPIACAKQYIRTLARKKYVSEVSKESL